LLVGQGHTADDVPAPGPLNEVPLNVFAGGVEVPAVEENGGAVLLLYVLDDFLDEGLGGVPAEGNDWEASVAEPGFELGGHPEFLDPEVDRVGLSFCSVPAVLVDQPSASFLRAVEGQGPLDFA